MFRQHVGRKADGAPAEGRCEAQLPADRRGLRIRDPAGQAEGSGRALSAAPLGPQAAILRLSVVPRNSAWLIAARTVSSWKGLVIREVGSGRSRSEARRGGKRVGRTG